MIKTNGKYRWSEADKKRISDNRKKYLKENPSKHPWKNKNKQISIPCEIIKEKLSSLNIDFIEEYQPLYPKRFFSIDIAFPDKKIGIEINGNQHYNRDGNLNDYYQSRHDLIESHGWKIYEFHYSNVYNNYIIENILDIINKNDIVDKFDYKFWVRPQYLKREEKEKRNKEKIEKIEKIKSELISSGIVFDKYGWVKEASDIIGITPQKVGKWMNKNLPSFYQDNCYRRK